MEDKSLYMDTLIGLLEAIAIEKGHISIEQVPNFPAETYRVISDYIKKWDPDFAKLTLTEKEELENAITEMNNGVYFSEDEVWDNEKKWFVCPLSRKEVHVCINKSIGKEILCPACNKSHLLPDGEIHNMQELRELNMFDFTW